MRNSLRFRLTAIFMGLAIVPLLLVGIVLSRQTITVQRAQSLSLQRQVAWRISTQIGAFVRERESELRVTSEMWGLSGLDREQQIGLLSGLLAYQDVYEELILLDGEGREQARASRLETITAGDLGERSGADEFIIPRVTGEVYYSPVWVDEATGEPFMTVAMPFYDLRTGAVDSVLVADFRFKTIWDLIEDVEASVGESVYVVDDQGRVVAHRNPSVVLAGTHFDLPDQDGVQPGLSGKDVVLAVARIQLGRQELAVVAEKATSEAFELVTSTIRVISGVIVLALAIAGGLGVLAVRRIVQPVEGLAAVARAIMAGDLSRQADVAGRDEITDLAEAFNNMTAQLRQSLNDLEQRLADLRRAEAALRESQQLLQKTFSSLRDAVFIVGDGEEILDCNPAASEIFGHSRQEMLGRRITSLHADEAAQELFRERLSSSMEEKGFLFLPEFRMKRKSGDVFFVDHTVTPLEDEQGERIGWVSVARDITERKRLERQMRQQEQLAVIGQLAGGIAHDFNNLLTSIILYAQMLLGKPHLPPDLAPSLETILSESHRAAQLVRQVLDFSRRSMMETVTVDLTSLVEEAVAILRRTLPENIHLLLEVGRDEYTVNVDPTRVHQVVMNLATNARDAMPEGGELRIGLSRVEVRAEGVLLGGEVPPEARPPVAGMSAGEWVCLSVLDTGTGMTEEVRSHLFEPFFTTKGPGKGTGLGLAQVHGIVKQHRGYVGVETEMGQGTMFRVYLPVHEAAVEEIMEEEATAVPVGRGETVLLVEDEEKLREAGCEILESLGYRVLAAMDGAEALRLYRSEGGVDLVVTDLVMPEMGGRELMRELRGENPRLKGLAITGYALTEGMEELRGEGLLDVVQKPFDVDTLARIVRRALDAD
jgi:PAS domain S-box-containing protein